MITPTELSNEALIQELDGFWKPIRAGNYECVGKSGIRRLQQLTLEMTRRQETPEFNAAWVKYRN